jgi:AraC family transcriptional regulator
MRNQSELSYRRRINRVVAHVNAHLAGDLDSSVLAEVAAMSRFHFHRVFAAMTGATPQHYVLRARLAAAIVALRERAVPVGEVAFDCGFESGAALAKAMRRELGLSPSAARASLVDPRMGFQVTRTSIRSRRRKTMLEPTYRELPTQQILCATERGAVNNNLGAAAQRAFARVFPAAERLGLMPRMTGCLGLCPDEKKAPDDPDMRFVAAIAFEGATPPDLSAVPGITCDTLPGGRFAIFRHIGPYDTLWQTWDAIYGDWAPVAQPKFRDAAPFEWYVNDASQTPPEELITDIHVPVA